MNRFRALTMRNGKTTIAFLLAILTIFSSSFCPATNAYELAKPTISYDAFLKDDHIKVFINGRYVEFSTGTGYPYYEGDTLMVPIKPCCEAFCGNYRFDDYKGGLAYVRKYSDSLSIKIDYNKMQFTDEQYNRTVLTTNAPAVVKDGIAYAPLNPIFESFGLDVKWDEAEKTAHVESNDKELLCNIDFKEKQIISISNLNVTAVDKIIFDGQTVEKDYVYVLKHSNQYKVFIEGRTAYIFSHQFLCDLNRFYTEVKAHLEDPLDYISCSEYGMSIDEYCFFQLLYVVTNYLFDDYSYWSQQDELDGSYSFGARNYRNVTSNDAISDQNDEYLKAMSIIRDIAEHAKIQSDDPAEQVKIVNNILCDRLKYQDFPILLPSSNQWRDTVGSILDGEAICQGYSAAFHAVMHELGIPCLNVPSYIVLASGREGYHMWNEVYVNEEWKLVDVTWNDSNGRRDAYLFKDTKNEHTINKSFYFLDNGFKSDKYDVRSALDLIKLTYKFSAPGVANNIGITNSGSAELNSGFTNQNVQRTSQKLIVNGVERTTEIFNIGGNNYFKLRDMAALLNGTSSQFAVDYDAARRIIVIKTNEAYTPVGGELMPGIEDAISAIPSSQGIEIDGTVVELRAYNIRGNNFFKLRDLGATLGFYVDYDATINAIVVESK